MMEGEETSEQIPSSRLQQEPEDQRLCRYCYQPIHINAKACHHCRFHQNLFVQYFLSYGVLALLLAFLIGAYQTNEARSERIAASEAVKLLKLLKTSLIQQRLKQKAQRSSQ